MIFNPNLKDPKIYTYTCTPQKSCCIRPDN